MIYLRKLYIIGNGFDLHHKINTDYRNYREYLSGAKLCREVLEQFPEKDAFWSDIEEGLKIDCEQYIKDYLEAYNFEQPAPGIVANQNQEVLKKVEKQTRLYNSFLMLTGINFYEWLNKTYFEEINKSKLDENIFNTRDNNKFINFNYTPTLQELYKVDDRDILHIHGDIRKVNYSDLRVPTTIRGDIVVERREEYVRSEMQFGNIHNKTIKIEDIKELSGLKLKNKHISLDDLETNLEYYLRSSFKEVEKNFEPLREFLDSCGEIEQVVIMGNYALGSDLPYYEKILIPKYESAKWLVYCYNDKDSDIVNKFREKYHLDVKASSW